LRHACDIVLIAINASWNWVNDLFGNKYLWRNNKVNFLFEQFSLQGNNIFTNTVDTAFYFRDNRRLRYKKRKNFCPAEALQVVCNVDDGPKTDWQVVCIRKLSMLVQVGNQFK